MITDLGILEPDPDSCELTLTKIHQNVDVDAVIAATGWKLKISKDLEVTTPPTDQELLFLRKLNPPKKS